MSVVKSWSCYHHKKGIKQIKALAVYSEMVKNAVHVLFAREHIKHVLHSTWHGLNGCVQ